ncbi:hypothetical protein M8J75_010709 [Diaphorina citri]|nr:hypothetical protein M8J75_010709 [Diaphorina citri]
MKLLRRMGWKPGQGIGPRLSRREKQAATARDLSRPKVYGCAMPGDREGAAGKGQEEEEEEEEECESGFTYAPNEYVQYLVKPKDDEFGLGYKGLDRKPVLSSEKRGFNLFDLDEPPGRNEAQDSGVTFIGRNNKKIKIHGQAFGVGAFEVEDDDIYATEDMSRYDTSLAPTGTRAPREPKSKPRGPKEPREGELEGFHLCEAQCVFGKFFPPPVLPPNYVPRAPALGTALRTPANSLPPDIPGDHPIKHARSAFERAAILDEPLPFVPPVDSGLSGIPAVQSGSSGVPAVESGVPAMQSGSFIVPPTGESRSTLSDSNQRDTTKAETKERPQGENRILAKEGHSVGSTFRPFANDPDKQKRYEQYITFVKLGVKDRLAQIQPPSMTEWERQREAQEFASAHALYLPLSGAMADRFTRGSQADDTNPLVKVEKSIDPGDETLRNAAKSKMFGKLTRELSVWVPSDLLCKRFNIKPPVFDYKNPAVQKKRRNTNYSLFEFLNNPNDQAVQSGPSHQLNEGAAQTGSSQSNEGQAGPSSQVSNDRVSKNWGERLPNPLRDEDEKLGKQAVNPEPARRLEDIPDEKLGKQAVNPEPARRLEDIPLTAENKVDLFKAIFLSSDEEDEPDPEPNEDQKHLDPKDKTEEDNQNNTKSRDSTNNIPDNTKNKDITNINRTNTDNHEGTSQSCDKTLVANPMQSMDREMRGNCDQQTGLGPARSNSSQEGSESAQMGYESAQMGDESAQMGNESAQMGCESAQMGYESAQMGSESAQMGNESAQMGSESTQMGQNSKEIGFNPVIRPQSNQMISESDESSYGPRLPGQASDTSNTTKNIPSAKTNAMSAPEETCQPNVFDVHTTTHSLQNSEVMGIRFEKPAAKDAKTKDPSGGADAKAIAGVKADGGVANSKSEETDDDGDMWVDADEVSSDEEGNSGSERSRKEKRKSREGLTKSQSKERKSKSNERRKKSKDRKGRRRKHSESSSDSEGDGKTSESRGRKRKSKRKHESSEEEEEERRKNKRKGDEEEEKRRKGRRKEDSSDSERHAKSSHRKKERRKRDSGSEGEIRHKSKKKHYSSDSDSEGEKRHKSKKKHYSSDDDGSGDKKRKSKKARYSSDSDSEGEKRHKSKKKYYSSDSEEDKRRKSKKKKHKKRSKR